MNCLDLHYCSVSMYSILMLERLGVCFYHFLVSCFIYFSCLFFHFLTVSTSSQLLFPPSLSHSLSPISSVLLLLCMGCPIFCLYLLFSLSSPLSFCVPLFPPLLNLYNLPVDSSHPGKHELTQT